MLMAMLAALTLGSAVPQEAPTETGTEVENWDGWKKLKLTITNDPSDEADLITVAHIVYTPRTDTPGTALYCNEGQLRVRFSTEPVDMRATIQKLWPRARYRTLSLVIDGDKREATRWTYRPDEKLMVAMNRKASAQVFNAVVKGQDIRFEMRGKTVEPHTPPVDDEFRSWVAACKEDGTL